MTDEAPAKPSVCPICSALTDDADKHAAWHESLPVELKKSMSTSFRDAFIGFPR